MNLNKLNTLVSKPSLINPTTQTRTLWNEKQIEKFVTAIKQFMTTNKYEKISYTFDEINEMLRCVEIPTQIKNTCSYSAKNSFKYTLNKRIKQFGMTTNLHTHNKKQYLVFSTV